MRPQAVQALARTVGEQSPANNKRWAHWAHWARRQAWRGKEACWRRTRGWGDAALALLQSGMGGYEPHGRHPISSFHVPPAD